MSRPNCLVVVISAVAAASISAADSPLRLVKDAQDRPVAVEAVNEWAKDELAKLTKPGAASQDYAREFLRVFVVNEKREIQRPSLSGRYEVVGDALRFTPQFAFRPGMVYLADFTAPVRNGATAAFSLEIKPPAPQPAPPTRVTAIYPSASTLPDNQLRFYIHFSAPMSSGEAYGNIKLLQADGSPVNKAFYELREELWDGAGQRFTLLCDPGRVKKGLKPREEFGPVLEAGQSYRLVIDMAWRDAQGQPLAAGFEKRFTAGPAVETAVDSKKWTVSPPAAGSRNPLVVRFDRSLDRALLLRMIAVVDASAKAIEGEIVVADDERRWEFRPERAWAAGKFTLVVNTALEDSAGNNLARPFEVDVFDQVDKTSAPELLRMPFEVTKK